jgi:putative oxidoreductase
MSDLKLLSESEPRNVVAEWTIRAGVAAFFIIFGLEKFSDDPASHWVRLFREIGAGDWFRYFTGVTEVLGGVLVLVPRTTLVGLILLALTMTAAALIVAFVLGHAADAVFPSVFLAVLVGVIVWHQRGRRR